MFKPKTDRIAQLSKLFPQRIEELEKIFQHTTHVYIDYTNVYYWSKKLGWHIDPKRLRQFLTSFSTIQNISLYQGTLQTDILSQKFIEELQQLGYIVVTKPVKIMKLSIDVSSIPLHSPIILENFIKKPLLKRLTLESIEFLNQKLAELNKQGVLHLEHRKCNFDVEIGRDMFLDNHKTKIKTFVLWSGDSDFAEPVQHILSQGKYVYVFSTARRVSIELSQTKVPIFDIQKIREFICKPKEISKNVKGKLV